MRVVEVTMAFGQVQDLGPWCPRQTSIQIHCRTTTTCDMEALRGLQERMIDAHTQLKQVRRRSSMETSSHNDGSQLTLQRRAKERSIKECALVTDQLQELSTEVKMFKSNGRASVSQHSSAVLEYGDAWIGISWRPRMPFWKD